MLHTIHLGRTHATVSGSNVATVTRALTVPTLAVIEESGRIHVQPGRPATHFELRDDGAVIVPRGLHPYVHAILAEQGDQVEQLGGNHWPRLEEADKAWAVRIGLPREQRELASCVMNFPYGQIVYRRGSDLRLFMATIIRLYPTHNILIVTPTRTEVEGLAGNLTKRTSLQVHRDPRAAFRCSPRRLVTTRFHFPGINPDDWDLVIFSDPRCLLPEECHQQALNLPGHQLYLLRYDHSRLSRNEELLVEAVVGPVVHTGPGPRGPEAAVEVHLAHSPLAISDAELGDARPLERKRRLYWHNANRNHTIAAIARAVADADMRALWQHGLLLDHDEAWLSIAFADTPTVAVIVEAPEHARELTNLLPAWSLLTGGQQRPGSVYTRLDKAIITEAYASEQEVDAHVVIVASGAGLMLDATRFPRCLADDEPTGTQLLIDLCDDVPTKHPGDFPARLRAYQKTGLSVHS